ncbi:MAG: asparagine synthase-related protein, partial [Pseudomonadota bacterium]
MKGFVAVIGKTNCSDSIRRIAARGVDHLVQELGKVSDRYEGETATLIETELHSEKHSITRLNGLMVLGSVRIDNRDKLKTKLSINKSRQVSDKQLVLLAFKKFRETCCEYFIGDYAFLILDSNTNAVFCARDRLGTRPLFYSETPDCIIVSSRIGYIDGLAHRTMDEASISATLALIPHCPEETNVKAVKRLLPATSLSWKRGELTTKRYWKLEATEKEYQDAAHEFRQIFTKSVEDRLFGQSNIASMLSGGLDSSAVTLVAAERMKSRPGRSLTSYSMVFPKTPELDESKYIEDVVRVGSLTSKLVPLDNVAPLGNIEHIVRMQDALVSAPGLARNYLFCDALKTEGFNVLLDGHGGDEVVGFGFGRIEELANNGDWLGVAKLIPTVSGHTGDRFLRLFWIFFEQFGPDGNRKRIAQALGHRYRKYLRPQELTPLRLSRELLNEEFSKRNNVVDRFYEAQRSRKKDGNGFNSDQIAGIVSPYMQHSLEVLHRQSTSFGIETRFPFLDSRLIELTTSMANSEKLQAGQTRSIMRRALEDVYPKSVYQRKRKVRFEYEMKYGLLRHHDELL